MAWVWPRDIKAVRGGIYGQHGADFDDAIDRLTNMLHRRDWDAIERRWSKPRAVAYSDVAQCAKTLIALSRNPSFCAGVIALMAALIPKSYLRTLPGDVSELQTKIVYQREKQERIAESS